MRLSRCCSLLSFLLLGTTCAPVAGTSVVIAPELFAAGGQFTVAVRFLREGTPVGRVLLNNLEGTPIPLLLGKDANRDYVKKPLRLDFGFPERLSDEALVHVVLFNNSQNEVESAFLPIADSRESTFLGADARVDHDVLENLTPVGFALLRVDPSSPRDKKIALLPYDAQGDGSRDFDLDFDTVPVIPPPEILEDGTAFCPFSNPDPKVQKLQCETFFALTEDQALQLLDCADDDDLQNVFEVDECAGSGDEGLDQDCSGVARDSCTPTDEDGDGACLGARPDDLFGDPATDAVCPNGFDDCDDTDPKIAVGCICDEDGDGFCREACNDAACQETEVDCDDTDPVSFPGAHELCDGVDNDCNGEDDTIDAGADLACGVLACLVVDGLTACGCTADIDCGGQNNSCDVATALCDCDAAVVEERGQTCNGNVPVFACELDVDCPSGLSCTGGFCL